MMRVFLIVLLIALAPAAGAQDRAATLADIRAQLRGLSAQMEALKSELSASGATSAPVAGGALERVDALESEIRRLTAATEALAFRIDRVVQDGTNRIGDLEYRLTELEGGEPGALPPTPPLGEDSVQSLPEAMPPAPEVELAVAERADFDTATARLKSGDAAGALDGFDRFLGDYPRSPLAPAAHLARGQALSGLGNHAAAGRAYLEAFTLAETSDDGIASAGLLGLGQSLARLEQTREACVALEQVGARYPDTAAVAAADAALAGLSCN